MDAKYNIIPGLLLLLTIHHILFHLLTNKIQSTEKNYV